MVPGPPPNHHNVSCLALSSTLTPVLCHIHVASELVCLCLPAACLTLHHFLGSRSGCRCRTVVRAVYVLVGYDYGDVSDDYDGADVGQVAKDTTKIR